MRAIVCNTGCMAGSGGDHLRQTLSAEQPILRLQPFSAPHRMVQVDLVGENRQQTRILPWLLNKVPRTAAHRLDGNLHIGPRGHHDHRQLRIERRDLRQQVEPLLARGCVAGVIQVDQQRIVRTAAQRIEHHLRRTRAVNMIAFRSHQQLDRIENVRLIVRHQQAWRLRSARCAGLHQIDLFGTDHETPPYTTAASS